MRNFFRFFKNNRIVVFFAKIQPNCYQKQIIVSYNNSKSVLET